MKRLLNAQYLPYLKFLEHCSKCVPHESISALSLKLNLDRRILLKTIKQLQIDIIENNWFDMITLELIESELTITCGSLFSLDFFFSHYMSKSFCVELTLFLFQHKKATIDELMNHFYISQSTFYRRIIPLKQILKQFKLKLSFTNKHSFFIGEEKQVRHFFFTFFWNIFNSVPSKYNYLTKYEMKHLHSFNDNYELPIAISQILCIQLNIAKVRIKNGFHLTNFPPYLLPLLYISRVNFHKEFKLFFNEKNLLPKYLDPELNSLYFLLVSATIYPPIEHKYLDIQSIDWFSPSVIFSQKWINYYKYFFGYSLSNEDYFYLLLNLYMLDLKKKTFSGDSVSFTINTVEELLSDTPYTLVKINHFFDFLNQQETEFHLTPVQQITFARLIRRIVPKCKPALQVLICSKNGQEETYWMSNFIQHISPIPLTIHTVWRPGLDLTISDYLLPCSLIPNDLTQYFICSSFSKFDEWPLLLNTLEKLYYTNHS